MKGIVFTTFIEMVDEMFGLEISEEIIESCALTSGGSYSNVGTYDFAELLKLATALSEMTTIDLDKLLLTFGKYTFKKFTLYYKGIYEDKKNSLELLKSLNDHIHVEVKKLYPDAELPEFTVTQNSSNHISLIYRSSRPLHDFAEGLLHGCIEHYHENFDISREVVANENSKTEVHFHLRKMK